MEKYKKSNSQVFKARQLYNEEEESELQLIYEEIIQ